MSQERKRLNTFVDVETYERLKKILDVMGMTVTDFINQSMIDFIEQMEDVILNQDKDAFLKMMSRNLDSMQEELAKELKK